MMCPVLYAEVKEKEVKIPSQKTHLLSEAADTAWTIPGPSDEKNYREPVGTWGQST